MSSIKVNCGNIEISNDNKICIIAGPCQLETEQHAMDMAGKIQEITKKFGLGFIYKTSFDKANRTSLKGKRGAGLEASLPVFDKIRKELNVPILTDIHNAEQCSIVANHIDVIQIPAFLCRQTDLLIAAAKTNKIINVKKGQFLAPWDMVNVTKKISDSGNKNILVTERGASFGYNTLVSDMRSLPIMAKNGYPVIFDATHSVQQPGGKGESSGGQREFVEYLSRAAVAVGVAGVFIETHQDPDNAPSDGPNMVPLDKLENLLKQLSAFLLEKMGFENVAKALRDFSIEEALFRLVEIYYRIGLDGVFDWSAPSRKSQSIPWADVRVRASRFLRRGSPFAEPSPSRADERPAHCPADRLCVSTGPLRRSRGSDPASLG